MIYVKSILVGLATLFVAEFLSIVVQLWPVLRALEREARKGEVGIDAVALLNSPRFWIVALIGFVIGFWWQFRKASV